MKPFNGVNVLKGCQQTPFSNQERRVLDPLVNLRSTGVVASQTRLVAPRPDFCIQPCLARFCSLSPLRNKLPTSNSHFMGSLMSVEHSYSLVFAVGHFPKLETHRTRRLDGIATDFISSETNFISSEMNSTYRQFGNSQDLQAL